MALTKPQRRALKALANTLPIALIIGQRGIVTETYTQLNQSLDAHELIKIDVLPGSGLDAREVGAELAEQLQAELVQVMGHKITLFRVSERTNIEHIQL